MSELKITDEELQQRFEREFQIWAEANAPKGNEEALKSLAYCWFFKGHLASSLLTANAFERFGKAAFETAQTLRKDKWY